MKKSAKPKLYKIEKGIKLPAVAQAVSNGKPSIALLTMLQLENGESFLVRDALDAEHAAKKMRDLNGRQRATDGGRVFASRKAGNGLRIWRTK